ncbi:MAG: hypothetical protein QXE31_05495 [Candidatus Woesearchaeota archaeon]
MNSNIEERNQNNEVDDYSKKYINLSDKKLDEELLFKISLIVSLISLLAIFLLSTNM